MRGRYEKKFVFIVAVLLFVFAGVCTSCKTTGSTSTNVADVVSGNSYATGQLAATVNALDGTVNDSRKRVEYIITTSRDITDGVERIEYLFNEYESEVGRLLNEIDRIRSEIEVPGESNNNSGDNTAVVDSGTNNSTYP